MSATFKILLDNGMQKSIKYGDNIILADELKKIASARDVPFEEYETFHEGTLIDPQITLKTFFEQYACYQVQFFRVTNITLSTTSKNPVPDVPPILTLKSDQASSPGFFLFVFPGGFKKSQAYVEDKKILPLIEAQCEIRVLEVEALIFLNGARETVQINKETTMKDIKGACLFILTPESAKSSPNEPLSPARNSPPLSPSTKGRESPARKMSGSRKNFKRGSEEAESSSPGSISPLTLSLSLNSEDNEEGTPRSRLKALTSRAVSSPALATRRNSRSVFSVSPLDIALKGRSASSPDMAASPPPEPDLEAQIEVIKEQFRKNSTVRDEPPVMFDLDAPVVLYKIWKAPDPAEDPLTMEMEKVMSFTAKSAGDMKSFRYRDGELIQSNLHDLVLGLIRVGEKGFVQTFLLCSSYFMKTEQFLQLIILFYRSPPVLKALVAKFREKLIALFGTWAKMHPQLYFDQSFYPMYCRFVASLPKEEADQLSKLWEQENFLHWVHQPVLVTQQDLNKTDTIEITSANTTLVAYQLTILEQIAFHKIPIIEFHHLGWQTEQESKLAQYVSQFNLLPQWVASTILQPASLTSPERSKKICFWLSVLTELLDINNFNSTLQVYSALMTSEIEKLRAWKYVPKLQADILNTVSSLIDSNFKLYREKINQLVEDATKPWIPIVSVTLRDLTMIEDMPLHVESSADPETPDINWEKVTLLGNVLSHVRYSQLQRYHLPEDHAIIQALFVRRVLTEDELTALSKEIRLGEEQDKLTSTRKLSTGTLTRRSTLQRSASNPKKSNVIYSLKAFPPEFLSLSSGTLEEVKFMSHLGPRANLLELYRTLINFENQFDWPQGVIKVVALGICRKYLGFGGEESILKLSPITQTHLESHLENPTLKNFGAVKMTVLRELETLYQQFLAQLPTKD